MKRKGGGAAEEEDGAGEEIPPFSDQVSRVWCSRVELKGKEIYIVRHAQGQHNVSASYDYDPPLTLEGHDQVTAARQITGRLDPELVLVSPLRRTLQTAVGLFPAHDEARKMVAFEPLREVVQHSCNLRLDKQSLEKRFPNVDFSLIVEREDPFLKNFPISAAHHKLPLKKKLAAFAGADCTNPETELDVEERSNELLALIASRPETRIALVSHCEFLYALMSIQRVRGAPYHMYTFLENCQVKRLEYSDRGKWNSFEDDDGEEDEENENEFEGED